MPRYFFDMIDGSDTFPDPEGSELTDAAIAREEALRALGEHVRYALPNGDRREFAVRVRDSDRRGVVTATLSLLVTYPKPALALV